MRSITITAALFPPVNPPQWEGEVRGEFTNNYWKKNVFLEKIKYTRSSRGVITVNTDTVQL